MPYYFQKLGAILSLIVFSIGYAYGHEVLNIDNQTDRQEAFESQISVYEDLSGNLTFKQIRNFTFDSTSYIIANNRNGTTAFWLKFDLDVREDLTRKKVFEILDFKIDSFELYLPEPTGGGYLLYKGGDAYPYFYRDYFHKNFIFNFPMYKKGKYSGFIRVEASEVVGLNFAISDWKTFIKYSIKEYSLLSLFYGIIIALALLSLFLYIYLYEKSYLFYALYLLSLGFYFMTRDGLGFQYIWSTFPTLNHYSKPLSVLLVVVFHVFFVKYYLNTSKHFPLFDKIIFPILIIFPAIAYTLDVKMEILPDPLIALAVLFIPLFIFSLKLARKGNIEAMFFVGAYSIQFCAFLIFIMAYVDWIKKSAFIFYSINIATALETIVFSLALAGKVKHLLKEKEEMKNSATKILEETVKVRTQELEERNKQLDIFVYKASHDIKGPLKSMIGLSTLALSDISDPKAKEYFEYIYLTSTKLDKMVAELLKMGRVKDWEINYSELNLNTIIHSVTNSLKHLPKFESIKIDINIPNNCVVLSDEILLSSIFQNIIENAIKYQDTSKEKSFLHIRFHDAGEEIRLDFEDNGLGIPANTKEHIFDMFYKVDTNSSGTGLGLYLTKLTIEKLEGRIELLSEEKKGSTFVLYLKK
ncbi:MAG TPA: sensor histidine kinase [Cytophagaceae bacterium]|jgi:signal transduction histidine kinase|nr:sensor histidine kinase [Cytophagaceae bacterium]